MDRPMEQDRHIMREKQMVRFLMVVAAIVLVCGLFAQITVRAQVLEQKKQIAAVGAKIGALKADADNLTLCINQHHNIDDIEKRAYAMGMTRPQEGQVRTVVLSAANMSAQTVVNFDGGEING